MEYKLITTSESLREVCEIAATKAAVAIDTEFVRTRTLYPQLGLLQLYDGEQLVLIDPVAIEDCAPFVDLLTNDAVTKVLHSCSEDLETFLSSFGVIPAPIFDTQFAATILGMGNTMGYGRLVESLLSVSLDKGESRTDWLARPLSEKQCAYAANDVLYLLPCYEILSAKIDEIGKRDWVLQEVATLGKRKRAQVPEDKAYLHVKNNWRLNSEQLSVLRTLAGWRLAQARGRDMALNHVFKEGHLFDVAQSLPTSKTALNKIPTLTPIEKRKHGHKVIELVTQTLAMAQTGDDFTPPQKVRRLIDISAYKQTLQKIKALCGDLAQQHNVGEEVIASKKQMNQVLKWWWFEEDETRCLGIKPDLLSGWRGPLLQAGLIEILGQHPEL